MNKLLHLKIDLYKDLGNSLKTCREDVGWGEYEACVKLHYGHKKLMKFEAGDFAIKTIRLESLIDIFYHYGKRMRIEIEDIEKY